VPSYDQCILKLSQQDIIDAELADTIRKSEDPDATVEQLASQLSRAKREAANASGCAEESQKQYAEVHQGQCI